MSLHHATKAKLEKAGIEIKETPEGSDFKYSAFWQQDPDSGKSPSVELWYDDAKILASSILAAKMAVQEYHVAFEQTGKAVKITVGIKHPRVVGEVADLADLASVIPDVVEALTDGEADEIEEADAEAAEEEEDRGGSVVPDTFKKRYAEAGHPGTCGDWLAGALDPIVTGPDGKLDADAMADVARLNGVDTSNLTRSTPGWQGRFRMTARNKLVKVVAAQGFLLVPSVEGDPDRIMAPAEWVAANQPKVKEAGDKKAARAQEKV